MVVCGTKNKQSLYAPSCNGNIPVASALPMNKKTKQKLQKCDFTPQRCAPMICF